jgi:hypothetical protein
MPELGTFGSVRGVLGDRHPYRDPRSKAPIRFLNQRPFDQLFTWLGSPIFERPLCRFLHCDCDDERLLWPSLWSFPT